MLRTLFHNGWSHAKIRSNQGYVGKVRAPARARSRARKLGYARCLVKFGRYNRRGQSIPVFPALATHGQRLLR
jgi:hypothetical protein